MKKLFAAIAITLLTTLAPSRGEVAQAAAPSTQPTTTQFVRFMEDKQGGGILETAAVAYLRKADGVSVTLIGAVHIADAEYFAGLNESFDHYDALLYEMVKPKDAAPTADDVKKKRKSKGMIGWVGPMQKFMQENLDLAFQLESIKYDGRPNFVHADLDADTFMAMQEERNEGFMKLFIRAYKAEYKKQKAGQRTAAQEITPFHLLAALKAGDDRPRQLKMLFARQLGNIEGQMEIFEGPNGSVIITERNKKCLEVMDAEIAAGKKNIGIFYGAGHFPDMEARMIGMGFRRVGQTWRTAWNLNPPATQPAN
mgnify:CR=1 FL=1